MNTNSSREKEALDHLSQKLFLTPIRVNEEWDDANVIITSRQNNRASSNFYCQRRLVVTANAQELSWLFYQLQGIFAQLYDSRSKLEFFGRLANAAWRYQSISKNDENQLDLLFAVLHEAFSILEEMEEDTFEYFLVSPGYEIVDDFVEQSRKRGFINIEETKKFFAAKGIKL